MFKELVSRSTPALIVYKAAQIEPHTVSTAWALIRIHDEVEQTLHGQPVTF